jgi:hypothetical protein
MIIPSSRRWQNAQDAMLDVAASQKQLRWRQQGFKIAL